MSERSRFAARRVVTVVAALGGFALVASACSSGPPQRGAAHHASAAAKLPVTKAQVLDPTTSTTASTTTTTTAVKAAPTTVPKKVALPAAPPTTTTTAPLPPECNWANFSTTVTTDLPAYPQGQTVHITLTFRNAGPSCVVYVTGYGCPRVDIDNSAGQMTWTTVPGLNTGCAETFTPNSPTILASTWSQSWQFDWTQVDCSTRTDGGQGSCAGTPVPAGDYQIVGMDSGGASRIPSSVPLPVTIS